MHTKAIDWSLHTSDLLGFGTGKRFHPERVRDFLRLNKDDVSRLANVSAKSVRYDATIPVAVVECLEQVAATCNVVAQVFGGDADRTALWFRTKYLLLGDLSPVDMIRLRRFDRLRRFIMSAVADSAMPSLSPRLATRGKHGAGQGNKAETAKAKGRAQASRHIIAAVYDKADTTSRIARIVKRAKQVFGNSQRAMRWLKADSAVLGAPPIDLLTTDAGEQAVQDELTRIHCGDFA